MHATSTFEVGGWDEQAILAENGGPKATRAVVTRSFEGDIAGEGAVEWLMGYRDDGTATFVGLERIVGRLGERAGSFLLQHTGTFDGQLARGHVQVVAGTGTEGLRDLTGEGSFEAGLGAEGTRSFELDYDV
jgi:Protein of unknown function (DUF3224)